MMSDDDNDKDKKRGRGRPKSSMMSDDDNDNDKKRGRGRPKSSMMSDDDNDNDKFIESNQNPKNEDDIKQKIVDKHDDITLDMTNDTYQENKIHGNFNKDTASKIIGFSSDKEDKFLTVEWKKRIDGS